MLIQAAPSIFGSCLNTQLKHIIGPFGLLSSKPYTLIGSTIFPFLMMTNQMTVSHQGQLIVRQRKNTLVPKWLSTLTLDRKQELRGQLKLGKPIKQSHTHLPSFDIIKNGEEIGNGNPLWMQSPPKW